MNEEIICPKCESNNIEVCERGFKLGRAVVSGLILTPVVGAVVGMVGRKKLVNRCKNCGKVFRHNALNGN